MPAVEQPKRQPLFPGVDLAEAGRRGGLAAAASREARLLRRRIDGVENDIRGLETAIAVGAAGNNAARALVLKSRREERDRLERELATATRRERTPAVELIAGELRRLPEHELAAVPTAAGVDIEVKS